MKERALFGEEKLGKGASEDANSLTKSWQVF